MTPPPFRDPARSAARAACRAASAACGAVSMIASSASASRVGLEHRLELRGLAACDDGGVSLSEVAPFQCGGLRVDVDEDRCESRPFAATARAQVDLELPPDLHRRRETPRAAPGPLTAALSPQGSSAAPPPSQGRERPENEREGGPAVVTTGLLGFDARWRQMLAVVAALVGTRRESAE